MSSLKRINYIDSVKGIGIILVVLGHHLLGVDVLNKWINSFHMPLFFMVSGFLYSDKNISFGEYIKLKAKSLLYPYFTLSAVVLLWHFVWYDVIFTSSTPEMPTLQCFYYTISTFGYHAFWFIPCLFWALIIFRAVQNGRHGKLFLLFITIMVLVVDYFLGSYCKSIFPHIYKYLFRTTVATSFLWIGYEFKRFIKNRERTVENFALILSALISMLFIVLIVLYPENFYVQNLSVANIGNPLLFYATGISNSILIFLLCKKVTNFSQKVLGFFGKNSIIILAFHMDISIEIAYLILGILGLSFGATITSSIAIILEMLILYVAILFINKYCKWILKYPFGHQVVNN